MKMLIILFYALVVLAITASVLQSVVSIADKTAEKNASVMKLFNHN